MSGSIADLLARPVGIDVLTPLGKYAALGQTQAETQGRTVANALQGLELARTGSIYQKAGIPGAQAIAGGALEGLPGGAGMFGLAPGAGASASNGSGSAYPGQMSMENNGFPAPAMLATGAMKDPTQAAKLNETRRQVIHTAIAGAPVEQFPRVVAQLFQAGWMTPDMVQNAIRHPEGRNAMLLATVTPEAYQTAQQSARSAGVRIDPNTGQDERATVPAQGARDLAYGRAAGDVAGQTTGARGLAREHTAGGLEASTPYETVPVMTPVPGKPGEFINNTVQRSQLPAFMKENAGAREPTAADHANPAVSLSPQSYAGRVQGAENTSGNPGERNPRSTAMGDHQFLEQRWRDTVAGARPAWAQGLTDAQLLAARADSSKSAEMTYALAQENGPKLAAAGQPVNSLTLGLAHQFGADGADRLLRASPGAKVASLVGQDVIAANPDLRNATVSQVLGEKFQKYGVNQVDLSAPWSSGLRGAIPGLPALTPQQTAGLGLVADKIKTDQGIVEKGMAESQAAQVQQTGLTQLRELGNGQINTGSFGEQVQGVQNYLASWAPKFGQDFVKAVTLGKIDPSKAGATQEFVKLALTLASSAEKANNPQGGLGITQVYTSAYPNLETQPTAIRDMANLFLINRQRTIDHAVGQEAFHRDQFERFTKGNARAGDYRSLQQFDSDFLKTNSAQVYVAATAALNDKPFAVWTKGLTPAQQDEALKIMWRADPNASIIGPDPNNPGKMVRYTNPALAR